MKSHDSTNPKNKMKTITLTLVLPLIFSFNSAFAYMQEVEFEIEKEKTIDDIPFETKSVSNQQQNDYDTNRTRGSKTTDISQAEYTKDYIVAANTEFSMREEEYVDDIPFNTEAVFNTMINFNEYDKNVIVKDFCLQEEEYIDDIPFDTKKVIMEKLAYPQFAKESGIEGSVCVCCKYDENGFLKVVACNSSDESLRSYVISMLQNVRLREGVISLDKEYVLRFNFKRI